MSKNIPFAQTFTGAVTVAVVGGLLVWWVTKPTPTVPSEPSHPPPAAMDGSEKPSVKSSLEQALETLKRGSAADRSRAATSLGSMGSQAADAVPALIDALDDEVASVRARVAEALGNVGADAIPATERLMKALKDPSPEVVSRAAWALGKIGANDAVPELRALLFWETSAVPRLNDEQRRFVCEAITVLEGKVNQCWSSIWDLPSNK